MGTKRRLPGLGGRFLFSRAEMETGCWTAIDIGMD